MSGVLHHRLELAQAKEGDAEGAHQSSSSDIIAKEVDSFSFVHPPKCGTSMIALLRNYLPSCKVKVRPSEERSEELATASLGTKTVYVRTFVQDASLRNLRNYSHPLS